MCNDIKLDQSSLWAVIQLDIIHFFYVGEEKSMNML